ncbi:MAG: hypothetical protein QM784_18350 [Polyangiaceae bacterium]
MGGASSARCRQFCDCEGGGGGTDGCLVEGGADSLPGVETSEPGAPPGTIGACDADRACARRSASIGRAAACLGGNGATSFVVVGRGGSGAASRPRLDNGGNAPTSGVTPTGSGGGGIAPDGGIARDDGGGGGTAAGGGSGTDPARCSTAAGGGGGTDAARCSTAAGGGGGTDAACGGSSDREGSKESRPNGAAGECSGAACSTLGCSVSASGGSIGRSEASKSSGSKSRSPNSRPISATVPLRPVTGRVVSPLGALGLGRREGGLASVSRGSAMGVIAP